MQKGCKAPQAAGRIHTDFEKGFIMAEVQFTVLYMHVVSHLHVYHVTQSIRYVTVWN